MRGYNLRLQERHESEVVVARDALRSIGLVIQEGKAAAPASRKPGFLAYAWSQRRDLGRLTLQHLGLSAAALLLGALVAIPLGLWLEGHRRWAETVIRALGLLQTVPSLALLAFMIPLLGVGTVPAIVALWIYSLFPIVRNTYSGVRDADPRAVEAATALGMTPGQILRQIRLPLAAPVVMAGLRTAAVITVGTATLAAFIGAGGLGEPIVTGLQLADSAMILSGAIPAALLALAVDAALGVVETISAAGGAGAAYVTARYFVGRSMLRPYKVPTQAILPEHLPPPHAPPQQLQRPVEQRLVLRLDQPGAPARGVRQRDHVELQVLTR